MCGIGGILGVPKEKAEPAARAMLTALRHRGPDDSGYAAVQDPFGKSHPAILLHTRLSILDTSSAGHQPMWDRSRPQANLITYNGEVYNFAGIAHELSRTGHEFNSRCDTEVILRAYREWGEAAVERMRGMFAWCILDCDRRLAWLCRDRLGIKPLYIARLKGGGTAFASEVRALLASGLLERRVDSCALETFLAQGAIYGAGSIVAGIELVSPGESLTLSWDGEVLGARKYWEMRWTQSESRTTRVEAIRKLGEDLREAVKLQLISDVPLGLFLSAGIDSTAIAAIATEVGGKVSSITIGFDQLEYDESREASAIASALGTDHQVVHLAGADVLDNFDAALAAVDQPTVDGFNTYFVSRAARSAGLKVTLSGLGGDELFGGYASFRDVPRALRLQRLAAPFPRLKTLACRALSLVRRRSAVKVSELLKRNAGGVWAYLLRRELFLPEERRLLQALPPLTDEHVGLGASWLARLDAESRALDHVNQVSFFELELYMRHMLLRDADVFSMRHGVELRVPLLDHRVVELVVGLPGAEKVGKIPKALLVEAVGERFPKAAWQTKKRGFTFPWEAWLRGPLRSRVEAELRRPIWQQSAGGSGIPLELWQRFLRGDPRVSGLQMVGLVVLGHYLESHDLELPCALST